MASYTSEQLKALLAGQLTPEAEAQIARDIELDPQLLRRLELLSGSGNWTIGSAPVPNEPTSSKLKTVIERVVSESLAESVSVAPNNAPLPPLQEVDEYQRYLAPGIRLVREIGRGGMGVVYEGWDEHVGRKVAVKRLLPIGTSTSNVKERLLQEARAAGALQHPNIVSIYSVHIQDDMPILVQQFIEGDTLQSRIDAKQYLSWQECVDIAKQIAAGLEAAHAAGVVHRDLKPDNILIDANTQTVRIADFGIAKHSSSSGLTASDRVAGTPSYMSPEQTTGESVDTRSDLFSLGSVLFAAATGQPPFGIDDPFVVMDRIRNQNPSSLKSLRPDYPSWLTEIIDRLLIKDRSNRTTSAAELIKSLAIQAPLPTNTSSGSPNRKWLVIAGVCLAAIPAIGFLISTSGSIQSKSSAGNQAPQELAAPAFVPTKPIWIRRTLSEFDSLAAAAQAAVDGDTIEIGEDMECKPMLIQAKSLTLKGADSKRPVLRSADQGDSSDETYAYFMRSELDLTLEGLEIDWQTEAEAPFFDERRVNAVVATAPGARLTIRDCTISRRAAGACVAAGGNLVAQRTTLRSDGAALIWFSDHSQASLEHCVIEARIGIGIIYPLANAAVFKQSQLKIKNCTLHTEDAISALLRRRPDEAVEIEVHDSILDSEHTVCLMSFPVFIREQVETQSEVWLKTCVQWKETRCVHNSQCEHLITRRMANIERYLSTGVTSLSQWLELVSNDQHNLETQSVSAKLTRLPDEPNSQAFPTYQIESTTNHPLPVWIDQVGPTLTPPRVP